MELDRIEVRGAAEHNLRDIDVDIPKKKLVVFTGVSGSGKSSLAFDTLYAEGQRRYVESLSAYARQFLGQMEKPRYDSIRGLAPTISIEQKSASRSPRSTVGTVTEIQDYLRVLWARVGVQHCHVCGDTVGRQSAENIVREITQLPEGERFQLMAPVVINRKGEHRELLEGLLRTGYTRVRINEDVHRLEELPELDKNRKHDISVVVDRLVSRPGQEGRLTDSVETALKVGGGILEIVRKDSPPEIYSEHLYCHRCSLSFPELSPPVFSFNSPLGMCGDCAGLGQRQDIDPDLLVPDARKSLSQGAIAPWKSGLTRQSGWEFQLVSALSKALKFSLETPWQDLDESTRKQLLYGTEGKLVEVSWPDKLGSGTFQAPFEGVIPKLARLSQETESDKVRQKLGAYMRQTGCSTCGGTRLRPESRAVRVANWQLGDFCHLTVRDALNAMNTLELEGSRAQIATELVKEIGNRLKFLLNVGLGYLSLDRPAPTLSGGESQRIRLASQVGSELTGVMYILDEPSIGLHQRDNTRLLQTLCHLRDIGNSVIVVEHDKETIEAADWVLDFGPGAGIEGGHIVYGGPPNGFPETPGSSATGDFLSGRREIEKPAERRRATSGWIEIKGARENNLKGVDVKIPVGCLTAVTGVSGAGKSSLVNGILKPALATHFHRASSRIGAHDSISGLEHLDKVIHIDQTPIGRTPRSNPATYTKLWDHVRKVFAATKEAKVRGYGPGRFSFNVKGGRCEDCSGDGYRRVEMHFLADVFVPCDSCGGLRFNDATLQVKHRGASIADVLGMSVREALEHFANHRTIVRILQTLADVGMGYIKLGQPSNTLSGGEAQRIKLSRELAKIATGDTLYLLDEPTTGLHFADIELLLKVLSRLVDAGNSVVVVEHNLDVIKCADWLIDLGPEGGAAGGHLVATGTPEDVAVVSSSHTGRYLAELVSTN